MQCKRPYRVTFTGVDNTTDPRDLIDIIGSADRLGIDLEFGFLVSPTTCTYGRGRFISRAYLLDLARQFGAHRPKVEDNPKIALHVCGDWTLQIAEGDGSEFRFVMGTELLDEFNRIQINFHGEPHPHDFAGFNDLLHEWGEDFGWQHIIQLDGVNSWAMAATISGGHPDERVGLVDLSHGGGITPDEWPRLSTEGDDLVGYAGGLGPHNIATELPKIAEAAGNRPYWIDMETHVRHNEAFSPMKCIDVLGQIAIVSTDDQRG